jgi:uncharacterized protein
MEKPRGAVSAAIVAALLLAACVTVNIYFPEAAAEKAADKIIQDVWGQQPGHKPPQPPAGEGRSDTSETFDAGEASLGRLLSTVIRTADAAADIDISTPTIERLTASMKSRHSALEPYYRSGAIGLTRNGLLEVRNLGVVPLAERVRVRDIVAQQNQARNALYREIAAANGHPEWEPEIRSTFAKRWVANARPGWWYQDDSGRWRQK